MSFVQVGDGIGGPIDCFHPVQWKYIPAECRDFILRRAAHPDRVAVACRRLIYCFLLSAKKDVIDINTSLPEEKEELALQRVLLDEHEKALGQFQFAKDDEKIFPHIAGLVSAALANMSYRMDPDKIRQRNQSLLISDPIDRVSYTVVCGKMEINKFRTNHTWILAVKQLDDATRRDFVSSILPFKLRSLVVSCGNRRVTFKDLTVLWICQADDNSEEYHVCIRNCREAVVVTNKGSQPYPIGNGEWKVSKQDHFIRNCEIAEKVFEEKYLRTFTEDADG